MSLYDYKRSAYITAQNEPFYALLMACMRQADTDNTDKLRAAWPHIFAELEQRYNAPGGFLEGELKEEHKNEII